MVLTHLMAWALVTMATVRIGQGHTENALYHSSVNFTCNSPDGTNLDLSQFSPSQLRRLWILPNDDLVEAGTTLDHKRVDILDNGAILHVREVDDEDFGWYHCIIHVRPGDQFLVQKYGLNVDGPYWGDLYQLKYKTMVTTGLIAGAACLVFTSLVCFCYGKQQAKLDKIAEAEKAASMEALEKDLAQKGIAATQESVTQCVNVAYVPDDEEARGTAQKVVTRHTTTADAEERGSKKGRAPEPPAKQELQNLAAAANGEATASAAAGDVTKL